ncbi:unnamed protein product, partial [marine sediment metagenome]
MAKLKKVYDFNISKVKAKLVKALKKEHHESTIADLMAASGLPKYQVEQSIKLMSDEYRGHLKVTESGEILYYFPHGMKNRVQGFVPRAKRFFRKFFQVSARVLSFLFKIWIMVMLVGYFFLFIAILVLAIVASIAVSVASKGRRTSAGGGIFSFYLVMRVFQLFAWILLTSGTGSYRHPYRRGRGRALHKSVFAYVFGEENFNSDWDEREKRHILSFIRGRKGVLTLEELMVMTGKTTEETQALMNQLLIEYEGEPSVTEGGTLVYLFPELLKSRLESLKSARQTPLLNPEKKSLIPFS